MKNPFARMFRARDKPTDDVSSAPTFYFGTSASGKAVNPSSAIQVSAVYACVRVIAETIASLPFHVYETTGNGSRKAPEHPLYRLIHDEPNKEMASFVLREAMLAHLLLYGNAYCQIIRTGRDKIDSLYPLLPDKMEVDRDAGGLLTYTYTTSDGKRWRLDPRDVLHIPGLGFDGIMGYSPIALEKSAIGLGIAAEEYGSKFFSNGARPSGILTHPNTVKDPAALRASWNAAYGSSSNASRVAVLEEGIIYAINNMGELVSTQVDTIDGYMTFGENGLVIGKSGNPFTFRVVNDRLAFYMNNTEVAHLSNNKLYVTQAEILTRLQVGKFAFEPQTNGNLSLIYTGYFEKENIWTFDGKGELMLTIISSLAQEESRSISENCVWGQRKRFADGKVSVPFGRFLGYDKGPDGNLVVNEEQAMVVRRIYSEFLQGYTPYAIGRRLTEDGIPTPGGRTKWNPSVIRSILTNEKYKGDALLQKVFTEDFITKKKIRNTGQVPQYYVEGNHEAIVSAETFDLVQEQMAARKPGNNRYSGVHVFSGMIYCGDCGSRYGSKVWHANDKYRKIIWQCNRKYAGTICKSPHLTDPQIEDIVMRAMGKLSDERDAIIRTAVMLRDTVYDTSALCAEQECVEKELADATDQLTQAVLRNASVALDQAEHRQEMAALNARCQKLQDRNTALKVEIMEKDNRRKRTDSFIRELRSLPQHAEKFDPVAFHILVERITVYDDKRAIVRFNDGTEIEA